MHRIRAVLSGVAAAVMAASCAVDTRPADASGVPVADAPDVGTAADAAHALDAVGDLGVMLDALAPGDLGPARDVPGADAPTTLAVGVIARVTAPDFLNLRDGPSNAATILEAMPCGATVTLLGGPTDVWWNVRHEGRVGWASGDYLVPAARFDPGVCPAAGDGGASALDVPASLIATLSVRPYVEESCTPATFAGWPYPAQRCVYGGGLVVVVADPSPDRVARWIVDSAALIPALAGLRVRDRAHYEQGLGVIARNVLAQSSRIFPLRGQIQEDVVYEFEQGVTRPCSTGCYCRINSTSRQHWCRYNDRVLHAESEGACLARYGTSTYTDAWAAHCLDNERAAWTADTNQHFRARAFYANANSIAARFASPATADGATVVAALRGEFPGP